MPDANVDPGAAEGDEHLQGATELAQSPAIASPPRMYADWIALIVFIVGLAFGGFWLNAHFSQLSSTFAGVSGFLTTKRATKIATPNAPVARQAALIDPFADHVVVYVQGTAVNVRAAPNSHARIVAKELPGTKFAVFRKRGKWTEVGEGKPVGWVFSILLGPNTP